MKAEGLSAPPNSVSLAGEFAVLSRLALHGYDANMTLGNTKGVDILVSHRASNKMYQLEVKTNLDRRRHPSVSRLFGRYLSSWIMKQKHESESRPELWYCFVQIKADTKAMRFFVVPSAVVAKYVRDEHCLWLDEDPKHKDGPMRVLRIGLKGEKYRLETPTEAYEDNWEFKKSPSGLISG